MNLLETTKLVKSYNGRTVVDEVSFVLAQEEIVGLLGRNGAGKTTTFRMILGMVTPDSGAVAFDGADITHLPMFRRAPPGLRPLPRGRRGRPRRRAGRRRRARRPPPPEGRAAPPGHGLPVAGAQRLPPAHGLAEPAGDS